jgi:hypothetical protein
MEFYRRGPGVAACLACVPHTRESAKDSVVIDNSFENWWSQAESNRWPLHCERSALPAELWPHDLSIYIGAIDLSAADFKLFDFFGFLRDERFEFRQPR